MEHAIHANYKVLGKRGRWHGIGLIMNQLITNGLKCDQPPSFFVHDKKVMETNDEIVSNTFSYYFRTIGKVHPYFWTHYNHFSVNLKGRITHQIEEGPERGHGFGNEYDDDHDTRADEHSLPAEC